MTEIGAGKVWIRIAARGRHGFIIATAYRTAVVVGKAHRFTGDGEPARWRAWLWPAAGVHPGNAPAFPVEGPTGDVQRALQRHYEEHGPWWTAGRVVPAPAGGLPEMGHGLAGELRGLEDWLLGAEPGERLEEGRWH
jgi:hypothetical protein